MRVSNSLLYKCRPVNHFINYSKINCKTDCELLICTTSKTLTSTDSPLFSNFSYFISCIRLLDASSNPLYHDTVHQWQSISLFSKQHSLWVIPMLKHRKASRIFTTVMGLAHTVFTVLNFTNVFQHILLRLLNECFIVVGSAMFGATFNLVTRVGLP